MTEIPEDRVFARHPRRTGAVLIVGTGAVGSQIAPRLADLGISLLLLDKDTIEEENLTRGYFRHEDVDKPKALALASRIRRESPWCEARGIDADFVNLPEGHRLRYVRQVDVVVAASDDVACQRMVNAACLTARKPAVFPSVWVDPDLTRDAEVGEILWMRPDDPDQQTPCYECWVSFRGASADAQAARGAGLDIEQVSLATAQIVSALLLPPRHPDAAGVLDPNATAVYVHGLTPTSPGVRRLFPGNLANRNVRVPLPDTACRACHRSRLSTIGDPSRSRGPQARRQARQVEDRRARTTGARGARTAPPPPQATPQAPDHQDDWFQAASQAGTAGNESQESWGRPGETVQITPLPPEPGWWEPRRRRYLVGLSVAALGTLALIGIILLISSSHGSPPAASPPSPPPQASSPAQQPAASFQPIRIAGLSSTNPPVISVSGTGDIPPGNHLRIFVYAPGSRAYYIDGDAHSSGAEHWSASPVYLGSSDPRDNGHTFIVYARLIDAGEDAQLQSAHQADPNAGYSQQQWDQYFAGLPGDSAPATRGGSNASGATAPSTAGFALPMTAANGAPSLTTACRWQYPGHPNALAEHVAGSNQVASYTVQCVDGGSDLGGVDLDGYCSSTVGGMQANNPDRYGQASDVPPPWNQWKCVPG